MRQREQHKSGVQTLNCVSAPLLVIGAAVLVFIISLSIFTQSMQKELRTSTVQFLKEDAQYRQLLFQTFFASNMAHAQARAAALQQLPDVHSPQALRYLGPIPPGLPILEQVNVNTSGIGISSSNMTRDVSGHPCFKRALAGERMLLYEPLEIFTGQPSIVIVEPLLRNGRGNGLHLSIFSTDRLKEDFTSPSFAGQGRFYITDGAGVVAMEYNPITPMAGTGLLDFISRSIPEEQKENLIPALQEHVAKEKSGAFEYNLGAGDTILFHEPIVGTDWHVFSMTPPGYLSEKSRIITRNALILCIGAMLATGILAAYIIHTMRRNRQLMEREHRRNKMILASFAGGVVRRDMQSLRPVYVSAQLLHRVGAMKDDSSLYLKELPDGPISPGDMSPLYTSIRQQLSSADSYSVQYRVTHSNGSTMWILEKGILLTEVDGRQSIYAVAMDISDVRRLRQTEKLTLDRMRFIMSQNNFIIFEMSIEQNYMRFALYDNAQYDMPPVFSMRGGKPLHHSSAVHPEDQHIMQEMLQQLRTGTTRKAWELRLRTIKGKYHWVNIKATTLFGEDGAPLSAIGVITDIHDQKSRIEHLSQQAERDSSTALYNKKTTEERIQDFLGAQRSSNYHYALFLVDVDNLKSINDSLGHQMGDKAISHVADTLRSLFREGDIVGRIGGDEFLILSTSPMLPEVAAAKAQAINVRLEGSWAGSDRHIITASIGVCFFPDHGTTFAELYARADKAAYGAKQAGKGCYSLFALSYDNGQDSDDLEQEPNPS